MGLFGGFKAKFTKDSTTKSKKKPEEVVCLRYHIHAEFDSQEPSPPIHANNIKKPEPVRRQSKKKERKALAKSAIFPDNETSQSSISNSTPQKSVSLTNLSTNTSAPLQGNGHAESIEPITISTTINLPSNERSTAISDTKIGKSIEEHNGVVTEKVAVVTDNHLYTRDHDKSREQHKQTVFSRVTTFDKDRTLTNGEQHSSSTEITYLKPSVEHEKSNGYQNLDADQSTLISMTQHSSRSSSFDRNMETDDIRFTRSVHLDMNKTQNNFNNTATDKNFNLSSVPNREGSDDEADYFKINVVKHDPNRTNSFSEDESTYKEEEPRFTRMGYSSQAASIFFGEGEEAEVTRPRRIQLLDDDDDDERRSSGADC